MRKLRLVILTGFPALRPHISRITGFVIGGASLVLFLDESAVVDGGLWGARVWSVSAEVRQHRWGDAFPDGRGYERLL